MIAKNRARILSTSGGAVGGMVIAGEAARSESVCGCRGDGAGGGVSDDCISPS